ncbi:MAG: efflux RND transporter permease subunit [Hyphomicrobiaceae bacterium]|nr:efflux RND transporter permease subunit [Hyphomicrobiaceae bacterium]
MNRANLSLWAVRNPSVVLFLILALVAAGSVAYWRLGRAEDPSFTVKIAVVTAVWPGATAREMQNQIADPIEKRLQEAPHFDKVVTYVKPSFLAIQATLKDSTPPAEVPGILYLIRKKLTDLKAELPAGVIGPKINDEYGDVDSILYSVTIDDDDPARLKQVAERVRRRLLAVEGVIKVNLHGLRDERIHVEFSHARLANLGIEASAIFDSLARQNAIAAAGTIDTQAQRMPLRVSGALDGVATVRDTPIAAGGRVFRLGDIAEVSRGYMDPPAVLVRDGGRPALVIGIVMAKGGNILTLGAGVDRAMAEIEATTPVGVEIRKIADQAEIVAGAIGTFTKSFIEALAIVLTVSFLSLGWRSGLIVAMSVPLVLAMVFAAMAIMGLDLQRVTLGALIIALGLLVDDAIIAVEIMAVKMEQGFDRLRAVTFAWDATAFPMLTGTLVTAAGFLPVGFAASSTGEYAGGIFWVVFLALVASWITAVIFIPYLGIRLLPAPRHAHDPESVYRSRPYGHLRSLIGWCVDHRLRVVVMTATVFVVAAIGFGRVQQQFFPLSERAELFVQMRLPEGTAIGTTLATVRKAEALIGESDDIRAATSYVGQGPPRFWLGLVPQLPNEAYGEIVLRTRDVEARERVKRRLESALVEGALPEARVRVDRFNFGPPIGFPVQFRVIGPDPLTARDIAYRLRSVMRADPAVVDPHLDWDEQLPALRLSLDQDRIRTLGLTPQDIAGVLQTMLSGTTMTTVRDGAERIDVVARAIATERLAPDRIGDLVIATREGTPLPLAQIAKFELGHEEAILWRRNRETAVTVRADVVDGVQAPDISYRIWPKLAEIRASLPPGYRIEAGGAVEESEKANAALAAVFPVMILAMLALMMFQLKSFVRLGLVLVSAPLGLIGASLALNLTGAPFGFVALLGLIALSGMDMRNSLILVDQVRQDLTAGASHRDAIVEATVRRARPVVLTALTAILAMIPLTGSAFWGPMAITIMGGLFVATFLTLLFLPALYGIWFRKALKAEAAAMAAPAAA